jgi:rSAM/selenodomain-associated transferase 1
VEPKVTELDTDWNATALTCRNRDAQCAVAIMGKASTPGRAKTRLVPPLTAQQAAQLNTAFLQDAVGNVMEAGRSAAVAAYVAYGPAGSEQFFRDNLVGNVGLIECSLPNFGDCLFRAVRTLLDDGYKAACVLNSDSPTLPCRYLIEAVAALSRPGERIVLGPSEDGGYYLLGMKRAHRGLFRDIDWSTANVCGQTCDRAAELGLEIVRLDPWYDVDDAATLERLRLDLAERAHGALHTRAALRRVMESGQTAAPWLASPPRAAS